MKTVIAELSHFVHRYCYDSKDHTPDLYVEMVDGRILRYDRIPLQHIEDILDGRARTSDFDDAFDHHFGIRLAPTYVDHFPSRATTTYTVEDDPFCDVSTLSLLGSTY